MKRILLLTAILFFAVISTACVNNMAIQELNNKAQEYMQKGDNDAAICRLEASLDLDSNIFETRYNLGVAYLNAQKFDKAVETLQKAIELKPDYVDAYYSLAVATDEMNFLIIDKTKNPTKYDDEGKVVLTEETTTVPNSKPQLTEEQKNLITLKVSESVKAYQNYLEKNPEAKEKAEIESRIESLNNMLDFESDIQ